MGAARVGKPSPYRTRRDLAARARSIAGFPEDALKGTPPDKKTRKILPPLAESGAVRAAEHDWITGGAYATALTPEVRIDNPGDVQIRFHGTDRGFKGAWIGLRNGKIGNSFGMVVAISAKSVC